MRANFHEATLCNSQLIVPNSLFDGPRVSSDKYLSEKLVNRYTAVTEILLTLNPVYGNSISKTNIHKTKMSPKLCNFHNVITEMVQ